MDRTNFSISVVVMILLSGCTQSIIPGEYLDSTIPIDSVVTHENQIKSVISQNCIACHSRESQDSVMIDEVKKEFGLYPLVQNKNPHLRGLGLILNI